MKVKQSKDSNQKAQEENKKVGVAFKSTIQEKEKYDQEGNDGDEDMEMFARKFNKFIRMKKYGNARKPQKGDMFNGKSSKRENDSIMCYECKKLGHIKFECPLLKKQ